MDKKPTAELIAWLMVDADFVLGVPADLSVLDEKPSNDRAIAYDAAMRKLAADRLAELEAALTYCIADIDQKDEAEGWSKDETIEGFKLLLNPQALQPKRNG